MVANRKKSYGKKRIRRIILLGFASIAIIITLVLTIGSYWVEIFDKYKEKQRLEEKLADLQALEKELQLDANKLQDSDYIARYAREKYSYSKDGEFIIKIPEK